MREEKKDAFTKKIRGRNRETVYDGHVVASKRTNSSGGQAPYSNRSLLGNPGRNGTARIKAGAETQSEAATEGSQGQENKGSEIDPLALPYVMMSELKFLPTCAGVYFAIEESGSVAYIGQSMNIRQRWRAHNVQGDLCDLSDLHSARRVRVAWLQVEKTELDRLEIELIRRFKPRLNANHIPVEPNPVLCHRSYEEGRAMATARLRIDELLEEKGLTAYWLGKETGINHATISQLRNGKLKAIRFDYIDLICEALDCEPGDFIVRVKDKPARKKKAKGKG